MANWQCQMLGVISHVSWVSEIEDAGSGGSVCTRGVHDVRKVGGSYNSVYPNKSRLRRRRSLLH